MKIQGLVTVNDVVSADGNRISTQQAVDYGWISAPDGVQPTGWGLDRHEVVLGKNTFVDGGRQVMAYLFGGRSPLQDYTCQKFSVGTGTTASTVKDVALEAPITLSNGSTLKPINAVAFTDPFIVKVSFTLGLLDANGYIISEMGLFSGSNILLARKIRAVSVNKTSDFSPTLTWRLRL